MRQDDNHSQYSGGRRRFIWIILVPRIETSRQSRSVVGQTRGEREMVGRSVRYLSSQSTRLLTLGFVDFRGRCSYHSPLRPPAHRLKSTESTKSPQIKSIYRPCSWGP